MSLFLLDNEDLHRTQLYEEFCFFEYMLRLPYQTSIIAKIMLYDVAIFLHEPDMPIFDKTYTMQHSVATFFLEQLTCSKRASKIKKLTQLRFHSAIFLSAFYCNYCLDMYDEAIQQLSKTEQAMVRESDVINMSVLFDKKYQAYESYPKTHVTVQTKLFKIVQQLWHEKGQDQFIMQKLNKIADDYHFTVQDMQQDFNGQLL